MRRGIEGCICVQEALQCRLSQGKRTRLSHTQQKLLCCTCPTLHQRHKHSQPCSVSVLPDLTWTPAVATWPARIPPAAMTATWRLAPPPLLRRLLLLLLAVSVPPAALCGRVVVGVTPRWGAREWPLSRGRGQVQQQGGVPALCVSPLPLVLIPPAPPAVAAAPVPAPAPAAPAAAAVTVTVPVPVPASAASPVVFVPALLPAATCVTSVAPRLLAPAPAPAAAPAAA